MKNTKHMEYRSPMVETFLLAPEGILCDSTVNGSTDTGASWKDETDASLPW